MTTRSILRIGLTGGIGSGKSTVAAMFAAHGTPVIDADEIARRLVKSGQPAFDEVVHSFGTSILDHNGEINRQSLRKRVFDNPAERMLLEGIIHPLVRHEISERVHALQGPYCIIVVPLLIEAKLENLVDRILVVDCPRREQIERVRVRSGLSDDEIHRIIAAQIDPAVRRHHADDLIANNAGLDHLEANVDQLHDQYLALSGISLPRPAGE
ncbi:MAG: dephospho-CoA kinase [Acidiferrobacterales bacterium]